MVFIEGNIPSSKNSKVNGKFFSKTVMKFLRANGIQSFSSSRKEIKGYKTRPITFPVEELKKELMSEEWPITIGFHFVRNSRHKFDFHNACQILLDLFTAFDIIPDDNMDFIIPQCMWIDDLHFKYDKENPGVFIKKM